MGAGNSSSLQELCAPLAFSLTQHVCVCVWHTLPITTPNTCVTHFDYIHSQRMWCTLMISTPSVCVTHFDYTYSRPLYFLLFPSHSHGRIRIFKYKLFCWEICPFKLYFFQVKSYINTEKMLTFYILKWQKRKLQSYKNHSMETWTIRSQSCSEPRLPCFAWISVFWHRLEFCHRRTNLRNNFSYFLVSEGPRDNVPDGLFALHCPAAVF